jgi:hypothetical protein
MKDELRFAVAGAMADKGESQAEICGAGLPAVVVAAKVGKSGKAHFSARLIFLPSFCCASQCVAVSRSDKIIKRAGCPRPFFASLHPCAFAFLPHSLGLKNHGQSNWVKLNQTSSVGQAGGPDRM